MYDMNDADFTDETYAANTVNYIQYLIKNDAFLLFTCTCSI